MPLTAVEPVPLKLTLRGRLPVVVEGTFDATTPLAMIGEPPRIRVAEFRPAAEGMPRAVFSEPLARPRGPQPDAPGTAKELWGMPVRVSPVPATPVVPVIMFKVNGPTTQLLPRSTPEGEPVSFSSI